MSKEGDLPCLAAVSRHDPDLRLARATIAFLYGLGLYLVTWSAKESERAAIRRPARRRILRTGSKAPWLAARDRDYPDRASIVVGVAIRLHVDVSGLGAIG